MQPYIPREKNRKLLKFAMTKIRSVPYKVSSRWVFYQLVQEGYIRKKQVARFSQLLSRARKNFYGDWTPDTLTDTIRECHFKGESSYNLHLQLDSIQEQEFIVQLWFEAEAMYQQFEYYTKSYRVSLVPFRGDCSIPIKWELAKRIEATATKYGKPVQVLYFGDHDEKGLKIYMAAVKDVASWSNIIFDVKRVGLTLEQARRFRLPENPDKPNSYQWEALSDEQARQLIIPSLTKYAKPVSPKLLEAEAELKRKIDGKVRDVLAASGYELAAND